MRNGWTWLAVVALAARVAAIFVLLAEHRGPQTYEHGAIAANLLAGKGFTVWYLGVEGPTSQQAPLLPLLLAGAFALHGVESPAALLLVQLAQAVVGTAGVLAVAWLARSLFPQTPGAAWWAGYFAALFPPHVYMVTHIQVVTWASALLALLAAVVYEPRWQATWRAALWGGVLSGLILLFEPILALALPWLAWVYWRGLARAAYLPNRGAWWPRLARAAALPFVAAVVIAPWMVRNRLTHGEWVFVKSSFGYAFWQGNNPHSWGTDKIPKPEAAQLRHAHDGTLAGMNQALWRARHKTLYIDDVLLKPNGYRQFVGLTEPERSRLLGHEARAWIVAHPAEYARLCRKRLGYLLLFDETNPKAAHGLYRASSVVWLLLVAAGLLLRPTTGRTGGAVLGAIATVALFHVLVIYSARFRIPLELLAMPWVGLALASLLAGLRWIVAYPARWHMRAAN